MADIFQEEFLSADHSDTENPAASEDVAEEEKKDDDENAEQEEDETYDETNAEVENSEPKIPTLEEMADSDFIRNRQMAAKSIVEYLHQAGSNKEALHSVISVMCKLFEDEDFMVRSELMEHIPSIALFCKEHSEDLGLVLRQQIVPYTIKVLTDMHSQVKKIGQTTLLILLENNVVDNSQLTEWICPLIAQLATSENTADDVSVMCKMIPYVGKEITEKYFLEPFLSLCCDRQSSTREVCLLHFGNLCKILGRESTETILLPVFLDLIKEDQCRIQCIDIAVDLASVVSHTTKHEVLSRVYIDFLQDNLKVWCAANLSLGRFISTFADPSNTGLRYREGMWMDIPADDSILEDQQGIDYFECLVPKMTSSMNFLDEISIHKLHRLLNTIHLDHFVLKNGNKSKRNNEDTSDKNSNINSARTSHERRHCLRYRKKSCCVSPTAIKKDGHLYLQVDKDNLFNNFQFWRTPLPEIDLDVGVEECKSENIKVEAKVRDEKNGSQNCSLELNARILSNQNEKDPENTLLSDVEIISDKKTDSSTVENLLLLNVGAKIITSDEEEEDESSESENIFFTRCTDILSDTFYKNPKRNDLREKGNCKMPIYEQSIVPPELLLAYVSDLPIEEDMRISFAYYFPSVVYTLGRKYWNCIRFTFHWLATDVSYSVRKSVAASLHELAVILGRDITKDDLFPVFREMAADEKLRLIVLKHVSQFLRIVFPFERRLFLRSIKGLCTWEEESNWRYRLILAEQLIPCLDLFNSSEAIHFLSVSFKLMKDKVSAVRKAGVELLAVSLKCIATNPKSSEFLKSVMCGLYEKYRKSDKWLCRQLYVHMCQELAIKRSLPADFYIEEIVPNLFSLTWDRVPNVRLSVARCLGLTLLPLDFLPSIQKAHYQMLLQVMYSLQSDGDKDVKYFAQLCSAAFNVLPPTRLSPA